MNYISQVLRLRALPSAAPTEEVPGILEVVLRKARRRRATDNWFLIFMVACMCVFAIAMATYVLYPAVQSAVGFQAEP